MSLEGHEENKQTGHRKTGYLVMQAPNATMT